MNRFYLTHFSLVLYFTQKFRTFQWFALQILPGLCMECRTWLKLVKREYSGLQILSLGLPKYFSGSFVNRTPNSCKNSKPFWKLHFGRGSAVRSPVNDEGLKSIQNSMGMVLDTRFHISFIMTLYYRMRQKFITKCVKFFITKCNSY